MPSNDKNIYKNYSPAQMEELRAMWREKSRARMASWSDEQRKVHNQRCAARNKLNYEPVNRYRDSTCQDKYEMVVRAKFDAGQCVDCLMLVEPWNHVMFAWDHQPQFVKLFPLSKASKYADWQIVEELAKCVLVCHNCHAMRTYVFKDHRKQVKQIVSTQLTLIDLMG
jgi:hypothetical protein